MSCRAGVSMLNLSTLSLILVLALAAMPHGDVFGASGGPEDVEWLLVEVGGAPVSPLPGTRQPFILLDQAQKKVSGFAGCNNFFGSYTLDGASLKFGQVASTRMACPGPEAGLEAGFFKALDKIRGWKIKEGELLLLDGSEVLVRLSQKRGEGLAADPSTVWQWVQTLYNNDTKTAPARPENYTVQFLEDGKLKVKADCNMKGGTYSTEGKKLSITITHSTMAACETGSLEDRFVRDLAAGTTFFLKDGYLYLDVKYDTGTMKFSKRNE